MDRRNIEGCSLMGRSSLPVGAWGTVSAKKDESSGKWRASCRYRGQDGVTRTYSKFGSTKGRAETALLASMKERHKGAGRLATNPSLQDVATKWLASIEVPRVVVDANGDMVAGGISGGIRRQTWDQYDGIVHRHIEPGLGALKINEIRTSTCDYFLRSLVVGGKGHTNARLAKTVLKQIMSYAIRHDLYAGDNPVTEVDRLGRVQKKPVGLSDATTEEIRNAVRDWRQAPGHPGPRPTNTLADVVEVLLGTGARIGEVLAIRLKDIDLSGEVGRIAIAGTLVEPRHGPKFRQHFPKNHASYRILPVPRFVVDVLVRRMKESPSNNKAGALFWSRRGTYMQGSSVRRTLRAALAEAGMDPVVVITPHAFRRTVATLLARELTDGAAASMLGHADVAMTHAAYIERLKEVPDYTVVLNRLAPVEGSAADRQDS
ncbi:site-specific integrase [Pseudarthrobacter sp. PH31-O2]|uniref:tyrosine-type recombinase/integrase n=1 Tax=Pseudarthrobacter sp. PH31-O2 TaxID=3046206 RepID=UPI0024BAD255|nr:site-specific integrase [Pseudarthrobacter sp. PH31-O2]MDJ0354474.1 tyrosine-type recombinase/integrase [Pseudarthrobacter sp. PH31-O2]